MSPDPRDEVDHALASGLSALAPEAPDGAHALTALRPSLHRARTRARLVRTGATVGALVLVGSLAALVAPHSTHPRVSVSSQTSTPGPTARPVPSSTTTVTTARGDVATTTVSTPTTAPNAAPTTAVTAIVPVTIPGGGGSPSRPTTATTVPGGGVYGYSSAGGSISVRFSSGALTLLQVSPGPGNVPDVRDRGPDRVEVRFTRDGSETSRIEIRMENGQLVRVAHGEG